MLTQIIVSWTLITSPVSRGTRLSELRLPSRNDVKYMPAGYKKEQVVTCPAPSTSSSGGGENKIKHCHNTCHGMYFSRVQCLDISYKWSIGSNGCWEHCQ